MRKAKGQFVSFITVFTLLFITFGTVFGSLIITDSFERQIEFNSGDISKITETRLKVDAFESRVPKEVNYTSDSISREETQWEGTPPNIDTAQENFLTELSSSLEDQISPTGCSGPSITSVELEDSLTEFNVELDGESINCTSESTEVTIPTDLGGSFTVDNSNNRYISALNYTSNYTRNLQSSLASTDLSAESPNETSSCEGGRSLSEVESEARDNGRISARSNAESTAEDERSDGDEFSVGWISLNIDSTEVSGSCSFESGSNSCQYRDGCAEYETSNQTNCVEPAYSSGTENWAVCNWNTNEVTYELSISDSENKIITTDGEINPEFKWAYTYIN